MADIYIENPDLLRGQPKRTLGDYAEQNGILVPRRFDSLREARASGVPVICRSEHVQDYAGASGILDSPDLSKLPDTLNESELKAEILGRASSYGSRCYCSMAGVDKDDFEAGVSFSLWEKLGGLNRTVVADSSVENRYHVMTDGETDSGTWIREYSIFEKGKVKSFLGSGSDSVKELERVVNLYGNVRNLGNFDPANAPIMEIQSVGGEDYFLQYLRGRTFTPAGFELERAPKKGEKKALFTRGATVPDGVTLKLVVKYPKSWYDSPTPLGEDGYYGSADKSEIYYDMSTRMWKLTAIPPSFGSLNGTLYEAVIKHVTKNQMHQPNVSLIVPEGFIPKKEYRKLMMGSPRTRYIDVFATSDGRKAYIQRI
jgi:hypothetical protein